MTEPSKSPQRHTFQKEGYLKRQAEKGEPVSEDYLDWFAKVIDEHDHKFDDPESRVNNLEYDLVTTDWILEKTRASDTYAQNLYAALCNNEFIKNDVWPQLKDQRWSCSWRYAGGIVADMQQKGDYIDWYCSGIRGGDFPDSIDVPYEQKKFVPEGVVTEEIARDLLGLGWIVVNN